MTDSKDSSYTLKDKDGKILGVYGSREFAFKKSKKLSKELNTNVAVWHNGKILGWN
jgi:hypothetical protein